MTLGSPEHSLPSTMRRADSTRSNTSSRSLRAASDSKQQEDLINALEAEEERLVNTLTRKLEKLRAEKAELENVLEAESESLVLRLQRQLSLLIQQQSSQPGSSSTAPNPTSAPNSPSTTMAPNLNSLIINPHPLNPSPATLIEVLKSENSNLRNRLVDTEREFIKNSRQNEMYRSELITLRQQAGMSIDDLIGAASAGEENYPSARAARRRSRGTSTSTNGIPIPGLIGGGGVTGSLETGRRSHHTPSFSSSSAQLSFGSSTPMTPNSIIGESNHLISTSSLGTSLTTPSTSYPGLLVPHSTPTIGSPANHMFTDPAHITTATSTVATTSTTFPSIPIQSSTSNNIPTTTTHNNSPIESTTKPNHSEDHHPPSLTTQSRDPPININQHQFPRIAESGTLNKHGNRSTAPASVSPIRASGLLPAAPENRQQFNLHH
ncbi:hypothetical protein Pst134EA_033511 [Puccinia striiformis f. sp. tritici]|uniref:hypothetical protein n=1 Tax=Puccinia striiformis f. sp. tritici TaxID=168172 RepID=UPI0020086E03|nr:hypothetical protein Pst134EA_033511 [Puccinia striiformis f. sp. tritici]KAH9463834.1 hypothetical protein Pst134EA_033511 [Puccinia striiformis f. sp. tritici]